MSLHVHKLGARTWCKVDARTVRCKLLASDLNGQHLLPRALVAALQCEAASAFVGVMITTVCHVHAASTQSMMMSDLPAPHGAR